jgi:hypothetical protein
MLIVKKIGYQAALSMGRIFTFDLWGETIEVKIRPRTDDVVDAIRENFKTLPEGKDKEAQIYDAMVDFIVEDFKGLADEGPDGEAAPWEVTLENKKRLSKLTVPAGEKLILTRVFDLANSMAFEVREAEQKN